MDCLRELEPDSAKETKGSIIVGYFIPGGIPAQVRAVVARKNAVDDVDDKSDRRAQYIAFLTRQTVALPQRAENVEATQKIGRMNRAVPARVCRQRFAQLRRSD